MQETAINSPAVWLAAIGVLGTFLTGIVQIIMTIINRSERDSQHADTKAVLSDVKRGVDGQTEALLKVTGDAQRAIGNLEGHAAEKADPS
jgi:hypothetical protein